MDAPESGLEILTEIQVMRRLTQTSEWLLGFQAKGCKEKMSIQSLGLWIPNPQLFTEERDLS